MNKYRKRPIVIEAIQFDGGKDNLAEILRLSNSIGVFAPQILVIKTLEGNVKAYLDDWIIRDDQGFLYPCPRDAFNLTYELVAEAVDSQSQS